MNIVLIGLGSIGRKHVQAIRVVKPDAQIFALRSQANAEKEEGIKNIFSFSELDVKPDFVIISNPTNLHYESILQAIELNVPLFIEKPSLSSLDNSEELLQKINQHNIVTYTACNLRFHPVLQFMKNYLQNENARINEVNIYCGSYLPDWRPGRNFREVYSAKKEMGGGVHLDLIHEIDYAYWLFGSPDFHHSILRSSSSLEISSVDYANYNLEYNGFAANVVLNYYRRDAKRTLEIVLDEKTILADLRSGSIKDNEGNILFEKEFNVMNTYIDQMQYFINCIETKSSPMNSFEESLEVLKICLSDAKA